MRTKMLAPTTALAVALGLMVVTGCGSPGGSRTPRQGDSQPTTPTVEDRSREHGGGQSQGNRDATDDSTRKPSVDGPIVRPRLPGRHKTVPRTPIPAGVEEGMKVDEIARRQRYEGFYSADLWHRAKPNLLRTDRLQYPWTGSVVSLLADVLCPLFSPTACLRCWWARRKNTSNTCSVKPTRNTRLGFQSCSRAATKE